MQHHKSAVYLATLTIRTSHDKGLYPSLLRQVRIPIELSREYYTWSDKWIKELTIKLVHHGNCKDNLLTSRRGRLMTRWEVSTVTGGRTIAKRIKTHGVTHNQDNSPV